MYVLKDGKILWFKNSKARKNFLQLKRKPLRTKWTEHYRKEHKKGVKQEVPAAKAEAKKAPVEEKKEAAPAEKVETKAETKEKATKEKKGDSNGK